MAKNISFEDLRALGDSKIPKEVREYASQLDAKAAAEKAKKKIVSFIEKSGNDLAKKQALTEALGKMVNTDKEK